jgi:hypothetical protein
MVETFYNRGQRARTIRERAGHPPRDGRTNWRPAPIVRAKQPRSFAPEED